MGIASHPEGLTRHPGVAEVSVRKILLLTIALFCFSEAQELYAQARFAPQLNVGSKADFGLGGRVQVNLPDRLAVIPMFDWFFPGDDQTYWELNGNLAYFFKVNTNSVAPYAGGGLNIAYSSQGDTSHTDPGFNLLGGTLIGSGPVHPFVEVRFELAGGEQFVLTGGVLF
jgi:hypothetical protein